MLGFKIKVNRDEVEPNVFCNSLNKIYITDQIPDITTSLNIKSRDTVYVVWIEYSTQDAHLISVRDGVEFIGIFVDLDAARDLQLYLYNNRKVGGVLNIRTIDGQVFVRKYCPWLTCYSQVDNINIGRLVLQ